MLHKFLYPIVLPKRSSDPAGTFEEGSVYYDTILNTIKHYSQGSWQFLPNFSSFLGAPTPRLVAGLTVCPFSMNAYARTTLALTNNTSYWIPFAVNRKISVHSISINVTGGASTSVTVGIYDSTTLNLHPSTLLGSVTLATNSTGLRTGSPGIINLTPGIYWIALASNSTATLIALNVSSLSALAFSGTDAVTHYRNTGTTLPSTAPGASYSVGTTAFPLVLLSIN